MPRAIYALLVGIDRYERPVPPLAGCVNDVRALAALLTARATAGGAQLHLRTLVDAEATRDAVIDGFRAHLAQAGPDDVALFAYSGHGSQQATAPEFWASEPDHKDETLVLFDSRANGRFDLADKELAKLLAEVGQRNPHLVVILDCCHSGTATRALDDVRRAPDDPRPRPLSSYLVRPGEVGAATRGAGVDSDWVTLPVGRHIVLSACRAEEEAKEYNGGGERRGAFSFFLTDALQQAGGLSYRDLFKRVSALVRANVALQTPVVEAGDPADLEQPFLGGAAAARPEYFTLSHDNERGWMIDGGAVHGLMAGDGDETTLLAIFPVTAGAEQLHDPAQALGTAAVRAALPQGSTVDVTLPDGGALDPGQTYKAVVTALPVAPLGVLLDGDEMGAQLVRTAIDTAAPGGQPSLYLKVVDDAAAAQLRVTAHGGVFTIARPSAERPLTADLPGYTPAAARQVVARLEHIGRWTAVANLRNPVGGLGPDAVRLDLFRVTGPPVTRDPSSAPLEPITGGGELRFSYTLDNGNWKAPQFKIRLRNMTERRVRCVLLDLTERFAISAALLPGGGAWLGPGEEVWALGGQPVVAEVPEALWQQGVTEYSDLLKLIVSTEEIDATLLEQGKLDAPVVMRATRGVGATGTLNRLLRRVQTRDLGAAPEGGDRIADWATQELPLITVRPQPSAPIPGTGAPLQLGAGIAIAPHPALKAAARLTSVAESGRDLGNLVLPPLLRSGEDGMAPLMFTQSRGSDPGLGVVELLDVRNREAVTPEQPLVLEVAAPLGPDERVLPVAYDGEFFLPLGVGVPGGTGSARGVDGATIRIDRLPEPVVGARSLVGSIRIFFQKVAVERAGRLIGAEYPYPLLAAAYVDNAGTVTYWKSPGEVRARVAAARRIVLYVHGIIGDTRGMAASARSVGVPDAPPLSGRYDLILTFDYENINTRIEDTARALKQRLVDVGLGPGHGKALDIVAHSMGGLVSRWFVEREGGDQVVRRLVLLGTPNAGSPWPKIQDLATAALALGLNGLTATFWPAKVVGTLVGAIEKFDVTLDQMAPGSDVLKTLASSPDPHVPYTILAGDTSLAPVALAPAAGDGESRVARLLRKLNPAALGRAAIDLAFWGQTNDIAVTVASIRSVPLERSPAPVMHDIACDHVSYFGTSAGLRALADALSEPAPEQAAPVGV